MKKKILASGLVLAVLIAGLFAHSRWDGWFPTDEMKMLRTREASLKLPKPAWRAEEDIGCHTDTKGAHHCDRYIAMNYADTSVLDELRPRLLREGWTEHPRGEPIGTISYFGFSRGSKNSKVCINGHIDSQDQEGLPLYLSLSGPTDESCQQLGE